MSSASAVDIARTEASVAFQQDSTVSFYVRNDICPTGICMRIDFAGMKWEFDALCASSKFAHRGDTQVGRRKLIMIMIGRAPWVYYSHGRRRVQITVT
jgi:hypothetical protein